MIGPMCIYLIPNHVLQTHITAAVWMQDSVYYHPTLNPTGAPPPGKPPMYKSSIGQFNFFFLLGFVNFVWKLRSV